MTTRLPLRLLSSHDVDPTYPSLVTCSVIGDCYFWAFLGLECRDAWVLPRTIERALKVW